MSVLLASLGALAIVAFVTSALTGVAWIFGASRLKVLAPAAESRLLMLLILLPLAVTAVSLVAYWEWPGEGGVDTWGVWELSERDVVERSEHARAGQGDYRHEDTENDRHEAGASPAGRAVQACLAFIGLALIGRFLVMLSRILRAVRLSSKTSASLCDAARLHPNRAWVLPSAKPEAFVLGLLRPKLFVSQGLLDLPDDVVDSVLAHERAHIARRDPLRLLVAQLACTFHVPGISKRLRQRAQQTQELVADAMAAKWLGDSTCVADALLRCARFRNRYDSPHLAFGGGDLEERVRALLSGERTLHQPLPWLVCVVALSFLWLAAHYAGALHHGVEILTN